MAGTYISGHSSICVFVLLLSVNRLLSSQPQPSRVITCEVTPSGVVNPAVALDLRGGCLARPIDGVQGGDRHRLQRGRLGRTEGDAVLGQPRPIAGSQGSEDLLAIGELGHGLDGRRIPV